ncbi:rhomboid family intramembrane serine protease [Citreimonas salinaria]|uniref:Membrane associated serine protease, rhomboid family n=1 Tax=Citreimonas salinaria TaxID=321339 RepID=A0A1H3M2S7_9RHOB|nr:rhomboid family intramembrane serine protease [Citreimonas salinaria]SDY70604.1 Membrane associated serine protease, rhomboid family [Citreimonas salinaria]
MSTEWSRQPTPIRTFVMVCVVLELIAFVAQMVGFGTQVRNVMIAFGGFWPGALRGGLELYPGQAILMFATSVVLHGGLLHLFMNMVGLMWLGPMVYARVRQSTFLLIIGLSALGSGFAYAGLSQSGAPMVGASGVLFGLVGVLGFWELRDRLVARSGVDLLLKQALALLALNVVFSFLAGGVVAWQAHLGGVLAGSMCGAVTWRRRRVR